MSKNHLAVRNIDFLLIVSLLDEDERAAITQVISDKYLLSGSDLDRDAEHNDASPFLLHHDVLPRTRRRW